MEFKEALARLVQREEGLDYLPVIKYTEFKDGELYRYSEYTSDYEDASFEIEYCNPENKRSKGTLTIDLAWWQPKDTKNQEERGFVAFLSELLKVAQDG